MKFLYKKRDRKHIRDFKITTKDIKSSNIILFSIFGRYGDSIIGFAGSLEFIEKYPDKKYIFITSPQNYPYMYDKTKNMKNVKIFTLKKDNIFKLLYILSYLKLNKPDLGFNPFSWSIESEFLITSAKRFSFFENMNFDFNDNYYTMMRNYLKLPLKKFELNKISSEYNNILICPESSEKRRSLTKEQLLSLINKYKNKNIILALNKKIDMDIEQFIFSKKNSAKFLKLVKNSDLVVVVDSAPLHIGMLYNKNIMALFSSSSPIRVLNTDKQILPIRNNKLDGLECEDKNCKEAKCLDFIKDSFDNCKIIIKKTDIVYQCPMENI